MAQITIDGCEKRHNQRRFLKSNPEKGTYDQILQGINQFARRGIKVSVRMNVDIDSLSIGSVFYPLDCNSDNFRRWIECNSASTNEECSVCNVLPICNGGCPRERVYKGQKPDCTENKYNINRLITFFAQEKKFFEKEVNHGTDH
jgi:radical SAM protein with 4Fe4S-binding SPASM domain